MEKKNEREEWEWEKEYMNEEEETLERGKEKGRDKKGEWKLGKYI